MTYQEKAARLRECRERYRYLAMWNLEKLNEGRELFSEMYELDRQMKQEEEATERNNRRSACGNYKGLL